MSKVPEGNIVQTKVYGNVTVHICSDFFPKTAEERELVLSEYHKAGWRIFDRLRREEGDI